MDDGAINCLSIVLEIPPVLVKPTSEMIRTTTLTTGGAARHVFDDPMIFLPCNITAWLSVPRHRPSILRLASIEPLGFLSLPTPNLSPSILLRVTTNSTIFPPAAY